ncbi:MAG: hypothetical protein MK116_03275 [Phycisphaerales bacterium]|nr:hypothetical protein [Phycisphaerales bacterium]
MNTGPDIVAGGYVVMGLVSLAVAVFLVFLVRGRPHRVTPACPRCRYCLTGTTSTTCPECGHDLTTSGVYLNGRRRWPRLIRAVIVIVIAILSFLPYRYVTQSSWRYWAMDTFGGPQSWTGGATGIVKLDPQQCQAVEVTIIYPDPEHADLRSATSNGDIYYWNPPEPVRLMMAQADGSRREYVIEPNSNDPQRWTIQRVQPMFGPSDQALSTDPVIAERLEDFYRVISERIDRDGTTPPGDDPGPRVAAAMAEMMIRVMLAETSAYPTYPFNDSDMSAVIHSDVNFTAKKGATIPHVQGNWFMLASWFLFWLIVLLIVIAPGSPTDPWEPEPADPGANSKT